MVPRTIREELVENTDSQALALILLNWYLWGWEPVFATECCSLLPPGGWCGQAGPVPEMALGRDVHRQEVQGPPFSLGCVVGGAT